MGKEQRVSIDFLGLSHTYTQIFSPSLQLCPSVRKIAGCHEAVSSLLPMLADTTRYKQYRHHYNLFETVLNQVMIDNNNIFDHSLLSHAQIPVLCKSLGEIIFKRHIELFFDPLFYSIVSPSNIPCDCFMYACSLSSHLPVLS